MDLGVAFHMPSVQDNDPWIDIVVDRGLRQDDEPQFGKDENQWRN